MLAAINITAIGLGLGAGGLSATVIGLTVGGGLSLLDVDGGSDIGLALGVGLGLAIGGWVAGRMARHSARFHGAVTGLLMAMLIVVVARLGGGTTDSLALVWVFVLSAVIAGFAGWFAGRRKRSQS